MIGREHEFAHHPGSAVAIALGKGRNTLSSPLGRLSLSFIDGLCAGRTGLLLTNHTTNIGRGEDCQVILEGETVSRLHCEIVRWGSAYVLRDLSRNGTFVNEQRIQQVQLQDGDQVRIGQNILLVQLVSGANTSSLSHKNTLPNRVPPVFEFKPHIVIKGLEEGVTQPFDEDYLTIGRRPDNHLVLEGDNISRQHAAVERRDEKYYVRDLGSANGTYLNEQRTDLAELSEGDCLRIGNFLLTIALRDRDCILTFKKATR